MSKDWRHGIYREEKYERELEREKAREHKNWQHAEFQNYNEPKQIRQERDKWATSSSSSATSSIGR